MEVSGNLLGAGSPVPELICPHDLACRVLITTPNDRDDDFGRFATFGRWWKLRANNKILNPNDFFAEFKQQNVVQLVGLYSIGVLLFVQASGMPRPAVDAGNIR